MTAIEGQVKRLKASFRDAAGNLVDPTAVVLRVKTPASVTTEYLYQQDEALKKQSAGIYYLDLLLNVPGMWVYRWVSTGTAAAANQGKIEVEGAWV
jgi:hypothetical protein